MRIPTLNIGKLFRVYDYARHMRRNLSLRVIALLIAIGLWVFVNAGQRGAVDTMSVPVSYRAIPAGLVIVNHPPEFVKIEVTGPRTLLSLLDPERLTVRLDFANVPVGRSEVKLAPEMFDVPRGTGVVRITPDSVFVDVDRVVMRELPVHLDVEGQPARGYQLGAVDLKPAVVAVSGPSRYVDPLQKVETEPLELKGQARDMDARLALQNPNPNIRLAVNRVLARVNVGEIIANREFKGVPVEVRDIEFKFKVSPQKASIVVRGPATRLDHFDPTGTVYVDASGGDPGAHDLPLQVDLPDGVELVKQNPARVRLKILKEKLTNLNDGRTSREAKPKDLSQGERWYSVRR